MPLYTVRNPETNQVVKFNWKDLQNPPTDSDIQEVFDSIQPDAPSRGEKFFAEREAAGLPPLDPNLAGVIGVGKAFAEMAANVPESTKAFLGNISQAILHPIETAKVIGTLGKSAFLKLVPGEQKGEEAFDQLAKFFADRYGSLEKFSEAAISDPVGVAADISTIITGGGAALRAVGAVTKAGKAGLVSKAGEAVGEAGRRLDPLGAGFEAVKRVAQRPAVNTMIKSVLVFPAKIGLQRIDRLASAFLQKGLNVTRKNFFELFEARRQVKRAIDSIIDTADEFGIKIKTGEIVKSLDGLIDNAAKEGFDLADINAIKRIRGQFVEQHGAIVTARELQSIKIGLNKKFVRIEEGAFAAVKKAANEKLRAASQAVLEELHPNLKLLNQESGVIKELRSAIAQSIIKAESAQTLGTKGLVIGGLAGATAGAIGGAGITGSLGAGLIFGVAAVTLEKILTNPRLQIATAKALHKANLQLAKVGKLALITKPAFQAGRIHQELTQ